MKERLIRFVSRMSRRPLALGTVLVAVRERETRPIRWEDTRPASSVACILGTLALASALGASVAERPAAPTPVETACHETCDAPAPKASNVNAAAEA
jgi:hypothetical protein